MILLMLYQVSRRYLVMRINFNPQFCQNPVQKLHLVLNMTQMKLSKNIGLLVTDNHSIIVAAIVSFLSLLLNSCIISSDKDSIKGNREYSEVVRTVDPFDEIEIRGDFDVLLKEWDKPEVVIEADANLHNYIYTEVKNRKLVISQPDNTTLKSLRSVDITIHHQKLINMVFIGNTKVETDETLNFDSIDISFIGSSKAKLDLNGRYMSGVFPGSSNIELKGITDKVKFDFSGASILDATNLKVNDFDLSLAGAGKADIYVIKSLSVNIAGAGLVNYKGNPEKVHSNIGGIGNLRNQED